MDAYIPVCDTVRPCVSAPAAEQPWATKFGTKTIVWYTAAAPDRRSIRDTHGKAIDTFMVLNGPVHAGLERLRAFKGWSDNWDAEGGKAPDPSALDFASKVFSLLAVHRAPQVTLNSEGQPMFVYGAPLNGEVVVTGQGTIDFFFADDQAPDGEDVVLHEGTLPADLVQYLHSAA